MEGPQVDVILHSLRELQKAKSQNESILAREIAQRKQIETQLEVTEKKLNTVSEKYSKMKEILQVADHKVAQTQAQVKILEQLNCERKDKITEINCQIAQKNNERESCMDDYKIKMNALTEQFRTSWHTQSEEGIDKRRSTQEQEIKELKGQIVTNRGELDRLTKELAEVTVKASQPTALELLGGVSEDNWKEIIELFDTEYKASMVSLRAKQNRDKQNIEQCEMERNKLTTILENMQKPEQSNEE